MKDSRALWIAVDVVFLIQKTPTYNKAWKTWVTSKISQQD